MSTARKQGLKKAKPRIAVTMLVVAAAAAAVCGFVVNAGHVQQSTSNVYTAGYAY